MSASTLISDTISQACDPSLYEQNGYAVLRGVFTADEVDSFQQEANRLLQSDYVHPNNLRTRPQVASDGALITEKFDPVIDISPLLARVSADPRILGALETIYGEPFHIFKDKLIFKLPGAPGYTMHQDFTFWQVFPRPLVSVAIAIDPADKENGALELFAGYNEAMMTPPGELRNFNDGEKALVAPESGALIDTRAGDVVIFDSLTPHQSAPNRSNRTRRQLFLTYSAISNGDLRAAHEEHYRSYMAGHYSKDGQSTMFFR